MMNDTTVDVNQLADQLAKIAGPIAKQGWEIYVRQQYVIAAQELTAAAVALALLASSVLRSTPEDYGNDDRYGVTVLLSVIAVIAAIAAILWIGDAVAHFVNPQFYAIQGILGR